MLTAHLGRKLICKTEEYGHFSRHAIENSGGTKEYVTRRLEDR